MQPTNVVLNVYSSSICGRLLGTWPHRSSRVLDRQRIPNQYHDLMYDGCNIEYRRFVEGSEAFERFYVDEYLL